MVTAKLITMAVRISASGSGSEKSRREPVPTNGGRPGLPDDRNSTFPPCARIPSPMTMRLSWRWSTM